MKQKIEIMAEEIEVTTNGIINATKKVASFVYLLNVAKAVVLTAVVVTMIALFMTNITYKVMAIPCVCCTILFGYACFLGNTAIRAMNEVKGKMSMLVTDFQLHDIKVKAYERNTKTMGCNEEKVNRTQQFCMAVTLCSSILCFLVLV